MSKLQVFLALVGIFALSQSEPTAISLIVGFGSISAMFYLEYRNYKNKKL